MTDINHIFENSTSSSTQLEIDDITNFFDSISELPTSDVTFLTNTLKLMMETSEMKSRYCYIRCLKDEDKNIFIRAYITFYLAKIENKSLIMATICSASILLSDWILIMDQCKFDFKFNYILFRRSYWGESRNIFHFNYIPTSHCCQICSFNNGKEQVNILYEDNYLKQISSIKKSKYVDELYTDYILREYVYKLGVMLFF